MSRAVRSGIPRFTAIVVVVIWVATPSAAFAAPPSREEVPKARAEGANVAASVPSTPEAGREDPDEFAALLAAADRRISGRTRRETKTPHFRVVTDVFAKGTLDQLAGSLEGAFYTIHEVLQLPTRPDGGKVVVYFFEHERQHYGFAGGSRGVYVPPGLMAFYRGDSNAQELLEVLVHESTHAFLDQFIIEPGVRFPTWLNEGFATYMGSSLIHQGKIIPGRFYTRQRLDFLNRSAVVRSRGLEMAKRIVIRIKYGPMIALDELTAVDRRTFYGDDRRVYYDLAWAFVHYLRHARPEGASGFSSLVKKIAEGENVSAAFLGIYSSPPASMEASFRDYVRDVLAKPEDPPREYLEPARMPRGEAKRSSAPRP